MRALFLHDNFPAQFGALGRHMSGHGWDVYFGTQRKAASDDLMTVFHTAPHRKGARDIHPYVSAYERAVLNGQGVARACFALKKRGWSPDVVMAHSGWGPGLFIKDVWPDAKYVGYFEWYYSATAPDILYLADEPPDVDDQLRTRMRNGAILADLASCDVGICPTQFQRDQFPSCFHEKLTVMHDGIDTDYHAPNADAYFSVRDRTFDRNDEIITYVARGMEPYRGFPEFMKAMETVLRERPNAHVIVVGEDRVAYGRKLPEGDSYKKRALATCDLDWSRVHFTGLLPRDDYLSVLQISSAHVYVTIPFVLSWSMLEAMSAGCAIVASDVEPVREIAEHDEAALMLTALSPAAIAQNVIDVLSAPMRRKKQGEAARRVIEKHYSVGSIFDQKISLLKSV